MGVHRCTTLFLDLRYLVWICLAVKSKTILSLLTFPSLEKEVCFFFPLFIQHFTGKICVLLSRREP